MSLPLRMLGAFAKHQRAQVHIGALDQALAAYTSRNPWRPERTGDVPDGHVRIRLQEPPPIELSLILGDIVHNLRSALDHATCALVEFGNQSAALNKTQFPFGRVGLLLSSTERKSAGLDGILDPAFDMIEKARHSGGKALSLLNLLSNQDKHRLLLTTVVRQYPMKFQIDRHTNTADIVPDSDAAELWFQQLHDGIIIPMPNVLNFRVGVEIEGEDAPFVINSINCVNQAAGMALRLMASAVDVPSI